MSFPQLVAVAQNEIAATLRSLPPPVRALAERVPVLYQRTPAPDVLAEGFPDDILGLFTGTAHGEELAQAQPMPAQILLYLDNIADYAEDDPEIFREEVRVTYLHELGHFLGWDEDDLADRGLD